jgi:hypothetical protein
MDIKKKLAAGHTRAINKEIVDYIGQKESRFEKLLECFFSDDMRLSHRSSWALADAAVRYPSLLRPHHRKLIDSLKVKQSHNSIRRNVVRTYQFAEIPADLEGELYDICFNFICDTNEAIAVKAFSIRVCERVIERYPEMASELLVVIKESIQNWSSGLKSRGNKFIKRWA